VRVFAQLSLSESFSILQEGLLVFVEKLVLPDPRGRILSRVPGPDMLDLVLVAVFDLYGNRISLFEKTD
jgi:hypothetical protein